jgi:amino-acid N-acetyltransferase
MRPVLRGARPGDFPGVIAMLQHCGLIIDDLSASRFGWFQVVAGESLLATGAVQPFGSSGLLRSVAVREDARGAGLGSAVVGRLEQRAAERGIGTLYLLTEGETGFFEHLGYRRFGRDAIPEPVRSSRPFMLMCPERSVCLGKHLSVVLHAA